MDVLEDVAHSRGRDRRAWNVSYAKVGRDVAKGRSAHDGRAGQMVVRPGCLSSDTDTSWVEQLSWQARASRERTLKKKDC